MLYYIIYVCVCVKIYKNTWKYVVFVFKILNIYKNVYKFRNDIVCIMILSYYHRNDIISFFKDKKKIKKQLTVNRITNC